MSLGTMTTKDFFKVDTLSPDSALMSRHGIELTTRIEQLKNFGRLVTTPGISDATIRSQFATLTPSLQMKIKRRMWLAEGGSINPSFASDKEDWAGDQIRSNPISRQLLANTVQLYFSTESLTYVFKRKLENPGTSDQEIQSAFNQLNDENQGFIKRQMWEIAGGRTNPLFASGNFDWSGDQLRSHPLPRALLLEAAKVDVARFSSENLFSYPGMYLALFSEVKRFPELAEIAEDVKVELSLKGML